MRRTIETRRIRRWNSRSAIGLVVAMLLVAYLLWSPGETVTDGRHDRGRNTIWLSHGWLGAESWFIEHDRSPDAFHDPAQIAALARRLQHHHITDVYPHLTPTTALGRLPAVDAAQMERFLDQMEGLRVMPWVGGVLDTHAFPESASWRRTFTADVRRLLEVHPRLAGIHLNVEPLPSGDAAYLTLLNELQVALPPGKVLSVAAYPPPLSWQPGLDVHWDRTYFRQVTQHADQVVVMMYDTALPLGKTYASLVARWTQDLLTWAPMGEVLLGLPAYEDLALYHWPWAESLENGLRGVHAGLGHFEGVPDSYQGIAIYSQWTMSEREWSLLDRAFTR